MKPLIITLLASLVLLLPTAKTHSEGGAVNALNYAPKLLKPISAPDLKPVEPVAVAPVAPPVAAPTAPVVTYTASVPSGSHTDWLAQAGIASSDWGYVDYIVMHEGHYDPCVINGGAVDCSYAVNGGGRAYGVCQALPGIKMASAGADWATNPITQLRWCASYAVERYGSWYTAYAYWLAHANW